MPRRSWVCWRILPLIVERTWPGLQGGVAGVGTRLGPSAIISAILVGGFFVLQEPGIWIGIVRSSRSASN